MKRTHKRLLAASLCLCLLFSFIPLLSLPASAAVPDIPSTERAHAVYFCHLNSGTVVTEKNADLTVSAGPLVKMLSGLVLCETLGGRLQENVTVNAEWLTGITGYSLGLKAGEVLPVEELLYAAICGGYNDAYTVLASYLSGTRADFVSLMNRRAAELGTTDTKCTDPAGITDTTVTTVRDLVKIALAADENDLYKTICKSVNCTMPVYDFTFSNRNALISATAANQSRYCNAKCDGLCAGSTNNAGDCVVASATWQGDRYLCVILGCESTGTEINYAYQITNDLINWAFKNYSYREIISPETVLCTMPVTVSDMTNEVDVRTDETLSFYLPNAAEIGKDVTYSIRLTCDSLEAPVSEHTFVGYAAILYGSRVIGTVKLYTAGTAERSSLISGLKSIRVLTESRAVRAGLLFFAVTFSVWMIGEAIYRKRRRHKWDKYFSETVDMPEVILNRPKTNQKPK